MLNGGKSVGLEAIYRSGIHQKLFERAKRQFAEQRFTDSLASVTEALQRGSDVGVMENDADVRDGAILLAWSLHQLRRYDACRQYLDSAFSDGLVDPDDSEAELIELWICWSESKYTDVIQAADRRLEDTSGRLDRMTAEFLYLRGSARNRLGEPDRAREDAESALALFRMLQMAREEAEVANLLGMIAWEQTRFDESVRWLERSLARNRELNLVRRIGENCGNLGIVYYKKGSYGAALAALAESIATDQMVSSPNMLCRSRIAKGNVHRLLGDFESARRELMAAYTLATERRLPREECLALEFLGDVFRDEDRPAEARRYYARGLKIGRLIAPEGDLMAELLRREGECLIMLDQPDAAAETLAGARKIAVKLKDGFEEGAILRSLARAAAATGDLVGATDLFTQALMKLGEIRADHQVALTHYWAARALANDLDTSLRHALSARHIFESHDGGYWSARAEELVDSLSDNGAEEDIPANTCSMCPPSGSSVIAASAEMRRAMEDAREFAVFPEPVMITGETGTGKDVVARLVHDASPRRDRPFVAVNCAAIPATLFEREFFGHTKGSFSGADDDSPGYVAQADGGTLFLDEIGELPLDLQPKLLRLLQDGTYTRIGDPKERRADIRLVAATNADLQKRAEEGSFRQDLFYRLEILGIELAPLRRRREDILPLLQHFLSEYSGRRVKISDYFDDQSTRKLLSHSWRGNVREVIMVARRAHIAMRSRNAVDMRLGSGDQAVRLVSHCNQNSTGPISRDRIASALASNNGNKAATARLLGVSRQTLYRWLNSPS